MLNVFIKIGGNNFLGFDNKKKLKAFFVNKDIICTFVKAKFFNACNKTK